MKYVGIGVGILLVVLGFSVRAEELAAPGAAVGAAPAITCCTGSTMRIAVIPTQNTVLTLTADGKIMRGDKELKDLPREELLTVINELIDLIKRR